VLRRRLPGGRHGDAKDRTDSLTLPKPNGEVPVAERYITVLSMRLAPANNCPRSAITERASAVEDRSSAAQASAPLG